MSVLIFPCIFSGFLVLLFWSGLLCYCDCVPPCVVPPSPPVCDVMVSPYTGGNKNYEVPHRQFWCEQPVWERELRVLREDHG